MLTKHIFSFFMYKTFKQQKVKLCLSDGHNRPEARDSLGRRPGGVRRKMLRIRRLAEGVRCGWKEGWEGNDPTISIPVFQKKGDYEWAWSSSGVRSLPPVPATFPVPLPRLLPPPLLLTLLLLLLLPCRAPNAMVKGD
jgi:hypothetical protein